MDPELEQAVIDALFDAIVGLEVEGGTDGAWADLAAKGPGEGPDQTLAGRVVWLLHLNRSWNEIPADAAYRALMYDFSGDGGPQSALVSDAAELMRAVCIAHGQPTEGVAALAPGRSARARAIAVRLRVLSAVAAAVATAVVSVNLAPPPGAARLPIARWAESFATDLGRDDAAAACAAEVAVCLAVLSDDDPQARVATFDAFEHAVELLVNTDGATREQTAARLGRLMVGRPWLEPFAVPIALRILEGEAKAQVVAEVQVRNWPARVTRMSGDEAAAVGYDVLHAFHLTPKIDAVRRTLEPLENVETANLDFIAQELDHPAYRRAVPHNRSFMREALFPSQVLVLIHEMTHAFSMIGFLSGTTSVLRAAQAAHAERLGRYRSADTGEPDLKPGDARALIAAESELEAELRPDLPGRNRNPAPFAGSCRWRSRRPRRAH